MPPSDKVIISKLSGINWDFPGATTLQDTVHSLHRFPGNFIPQVPSYLIQILTERNDIVLDPFCGSGTTGVEAALVGRQAVLSDVNHASIQVTTGKMALIASKTAVLDIKAVLQRLSTFPLHRPKGQTDFPICEVDLSAWLHRETLADLKSIWILIESTQNEALKDVLKMLFTDTLFACASTVSSRTSGGKTRRHHWGWIADNVKPPSPLYHDAVKLFRTRLLHAYDVASRLDERPRQPINDHFSSLRVQRVDVRQMTLASSSIDAIVTSPPYLGMIDYTLANRLSYQWFGWPQEEDKAMEIGARYRRGRSKAVKEYLVSIEESCVRMADVLKERGFCAIVIGASRKFPETTNSVLKIFGSYFKPFWGPVLRTPSRRRVSERKGTEFYESLAIFRK
jgi:DNA modification methylase